jgi:hypothetical protein
MLSGPNAGISFSSPGFLLQSFIASSSGTSRQAGAALGWELRRMMTRFLLFHQTQDTTLDSRTSLNPMMSLTGYPSVAVPNGVT